MHFYLVEELFPCRLLFEAGRILKIQVPTKVINNLGISYKGWMYTFG